MKAQGIIGGHDSQLGNVSLGFDRNDYVVVTWIGNIHRDNDTSELYYGRDDGGLPKKLDKFVATPLTPSEYQEAINFGAILKVLSRGAIVDSGGGSGPPGGGGGGPPSFPPGVTFRPIDGGVTYYQSNGFTNAANASFNGMSWDDPAFFPIGQDYSFYSFNSPTIFRDLGLNFSHRVTSDTNLSILRNAGIWCVPSPGEGSNFGIETVGWHVEEPSSWSDIITGFSDAGSGAAGRFFHISNTWNQFVYNNIGGTPCGDGTMPFVMSCTTGIPGNRHLDIPSADIYWFAISGQSGDAPSGPGISGLFYDIGRNATADEMARGTNYGDMVDLMRAWLHVNPAPVIAPYIETEDGLVGTGARRITPPQLNWAVWSTLIHGARGVLYFGTTSNFGSGGTFGFSTNILSGQSISVYDQAKSTNKLITNLARILNSTFALGYASVSPAGYAFPTPHIVLDNGTIDMMVKYYSGSSFSNSSGTFGPGFYIFATVRGSETLSNISATFTIAGNYSGGIPVIRNAGRPNQSSGTIAISSQSFSDTFADSHDIHIYGPIPNA